MAAPPKYPTPHSQLLALALEARREGLSFGEFWERAVRPGQPAVTVGTPERRRPEGCVLWQRDTFDRNNARAAMEEIKGGWRRAYENLPPTRSEMALIMLGPDLRVTAAQVRAAPELARLAEGLPAAAAVSSAA